MRRAEGPSADGRREREGPDAAELTGTSPKGASPAKTRLDGDRRPRKRRERLGTSPCTEEPSSGSLLRRATCPEGQEGQRRDRASEDPRAARDLSPPSSLGLRPSPLRASARRTGRTVARARGATCPTAAAGRPVSFTVVSFRERTPPPEHDRSAPPPRSRLGRREATTGEGCAPGRARKIPSEAFCRRVREGDAGPPP